MMRPLQMRFAQRVNRVRGLKGHVWQGRYFSSALDHAYMWAAIRYVERNPVRANISERAEDYPWSSAAAHCGLRFDPLLTVKSPWQQLTAGIGDWSAWLAKGDEQRSIDKLRDHVSKGLPCGIPTFIENLECSTGRVLHCRPRGRPKKPRVK